MDGKLKSKRTGQEWSTPQEYFSYAVSKATTPEQKQSIEQMGPEQVWQAATSSGKFDVVSTPAQATQSTPDKSFSGVLAENFNRIPYLGVPDIGMIPGVRRTEVIKNMPGSAVKAVAGVVTGIPSLIGAVYDVGKDVVNQGSLSPAIKAGKGAIKAIAEDYGDYYLGDDVSGNIEKDPFRLISDIAAIASTGVSSSSRLRSATGVSAAGVDAASLNPLQLIPSSETIKAAQDKLGNFIYRQSLNLPRSVPMPERKEIAAFGVEKGIRMSEEGQAKAKGIFKESASGMKQASQQEELKGTLIDPQYAQSKVDKAVSEFDIDPRERQYAENIAGRTMQNVFPPTVFPNTPGPIAPMMAEKVKEKLNRNLEKLQGNRNRINTTKSSIAESVKMAILDGIREAQGHAITDTIMIDGKPYSYREAGKVASLSKKMENIAESLVALMDTSAAGTSSMTEGAAVGSALRGQAFTPSQIGWISKYVMRPDVMSGLGIQLVKSSKTGSKADRMKSAAIPIGAAARARARSNQSTEDPNSDEPSPFAGAKEDDDEPSPFIKK